MSGGLTDEHIAWVRAFTGIDPAGQAAPGGPGKTGSAPGGVLGTFGDVVADMAHTALNTVKKVGEAIAAVVQKQKSSTIGPTQQKRADAMQAKLSPADQKKYQTLLDGAKSDKQRDYLAKGLASGHSVSELQAFNARVAGKDE